MISFWNVTSDKLSGVSIDSTQEKIIFVSDNGRIYTDFKGSRKEYFDIIYVNDINNIPSADFGKSLIYFENSTNKLYFYSGSSYILLNPDIEGPLYIGKFTLDISPIDSNFNSFVTNLKGRDSRIGDLIIDYQNNQWVKVNNANQGNDWSKITPDIPTLSAATYETSGLIRVQEGCGLILSGGVLSLNLMNEDRLSGQIVTLGQNGKIDEDIYNQSPVIQWEDIN